MLLTDRSVPFPFGKGGSGILANCSLCGTEATFSFSAGQHVQVFPLKHAPFCKLFAGLCSTNKSATSLLLLLRPHQSPPCPLLHLFVYLNLSDRNFCLSPVLSGYNGSSDTRFFREMDELARQGVLLVPSVISCSLSSLVSTLFSDWRHTVLSKFFDTQVPSISTE